MRWYVPPSGAQVSHMVPVVYQRLVSYVKMLEDRLRVSVCEEDRLIDVWKDLLEDAMSQPATHRSGRPAQPGRTQTHSSGHRVISYGSFGRLILSHPLR